MALLKESISLCVSLEARWLVWIVTAEPMFTESACGVGILAISVKLTVIVTLDHCE